MGAVLHDDDAALPSPNVLETNISLYMVSYCIFTYKKFKPYFSTEKKKSSLPIRLKYLFLSNKMMITHMLFLK